MEDHEKNINPKTPGLFLGLNVLEVFRRSEDKLITFRAKKLFHTILEKNHQFWWRKYFMSSIKEAK